MNTLDVILFSLIILLGFRGLLHGLALEALSIGAVFFGLLAARHLSAYVAPHLGVHIDSPETVEAAATLVTFLLAVGLVWLLGKGISQALKFTPAGAIDRGLGAVFGLFEGYTVCSMVILIVRSLAPGTALYHNSSMAPFFMPGVRLLETHLPEGLLRFLHGVG
ncbi:Colicin V production protein [Paucidesulfovibrio gracilis DSM 16080]|uniref:Colicin V production protein n=1 Tax=Paucidesulfovibrio gracilis DSM 16080 TaxID=1121449 RepID=A0A1T4WID3_9BACT|nr:CvpA family protein [Paucidesulfovibrio gracilis]SKA77093.1 Colicin V production protein [Paucidesulfovibrio gracilis DSM 16080]